MIGTALLDYMNVCWSLHGPCQVYRFFSLFLYFLYTLLKQLTFFPFIPLTTSSHLWRNTQPPKYFLRGPYLQLSEINSLLWNYKRKFCKYYFNYECVPSSYVLCYFLLWFLTGSDHSHFFFFLLIALGNEELSEITL